jgi:hypothetical protein
MFCPVINHLLLLLIFEEIKMGRIPNSIKISAIQSSSSSNFSNLVHTANGTKSQFNQDWLTRFIDFLNSNSFIDQSQKYITSTQKNTSDSILPPLFDTSMTNDGNHGNNFLFNLLKHQKTLNKPTLFLPNTYYSDLFMNIQPCDPCFQSIISSVNDKIYQLYNNSNTKVNEAYERAQFLISNKIEIFEGHDASTKEVWNSIIETLPSFVKMAIMFLKEVPGLTELEDGDFTCIINSRLFDFYIIQNAQLFINGESYQILFTKTRNIQYTRDWMNKIKTKEKNDILFEFTEEFNKLNLTIKEKALLVILCFTFPGKVS